MAYNENLPLNDGYLAEFPPEQRENQRSIIEDGIVNAGTIKGLSPGNAQGNIAVNNGTLNTGLNAERLGGNLASAFSMNNHDHSTATSSNKGFMSNTDKTKLDSVAAGAEVNQLAFSAIKVGAETIQADSKTDTLELAEGANVSIVADTTNDRVTIGVTGKVQSAVNADTIGGKLSSAFAPNGYGLGDVSSAAKNRVALNDNVNTGFFHYLATDINKPNFSNGQVIVQKFDENYIRQMAFPWGTKSIYTRERNAGVWSDWEQLALVSNTVPLTDVAVIATANKLLKLNSNGVLPANISGSSVTCSGNAATATVAATASKCTGDSATVGGKTVAQIQAGAVAYDYVVDQSLGANGWTKWASGKIEQWGISVPTTKPQTISFPIAFVSACYSVTSSMMYGSLESLWGSRIAYITKTGFNDHTPYSDTSLSWYAVGK
jgi:hypothetical protein